MRISIFSALVAAAAKAAAQIPTVTVSQVETRTLTTFIATSQPQMDWWRNPVVPFNVTATGVTTLALNGADFDVTYTSYVTKWRTENVHWTREVSDMQTLETIERLFRDIVETSVISSSTTRELYVPPSWPTPTVSADITTTSMYLASTSTGYFGDVHITFTPTTTPFVVVRETLVVDVSVAHSVTHTWQKDMADYTSTEGLWNHATATEFEVRVDHPAHPIITKTRIMTETRYWAHVVVYSGTGDSRATYTYDAPDYVLAATSYYNSDVEPPHQSNMAMADDSEVDEYTDAVNITIAQIKNQDQQRHIDRTNQTKIIVGSLSGIIPSLIIATILLLARRLRISDARGRYIHEKRFAEAVVDVAEMQMAQRVAEETAAREREELARRHRELATVRAEDHGTWGEAPPAYINQGKDRVISDIELAELHRADGANRNGNGNEEGGGPKSVV